jgi:hypothetical protein
MGSTFTALKAFTRLAANSGAPDHSCEDFLGLLMALKAAPPSDSNSSLVGLVM